MFWVTSGGFFGGKFIHGGGGVIFHGGNVQWSCPVCGPEYPDHYKSLRVLDIICAILVNTHTHTQTKRQLSTGYILLTRSSATAKSTARPSCLVGVLYDISWEKIC